MINNTDLCRIKRGVNIKMEYNEIDKIKSSRDFNLLIRKIEELLDQKEQILIGIDGDSGSGKSTIAGLIKDALDGNLIHMDDFFLQPKQRTAERLSEPGGNVDYERVSVEVLEKIKSNNEFTYGKFECESMTITKQITIDWKPLNIIEGVYSLHPALIEFYDYKIFLKVKPETQETRIFERNGKEALEVFKDRWIPMEKLYFQTYSIEKAVDLVIDTSDI
jgi:uridine kinase